jgi:hypothetical protein
MANIRIHDVAVKCDDREHGVIASRQPAVCTENPIRIDDVTESPKLAE